MAVLYEAGEFVTPQLLSCKENELGLRQWLEEKVLSWQAPVEVDLSSCYCSDTQLHKFTLIAPSLRRAMSMLW